MHRSSKNYKNPVDKVIADRLDRERDKMLKVEKKIKKMQGMGREYKEIKKIKKALDEQMSIIDKILAYWNKRRGR